MNRFFDGGKIMQLFRFVTMDDKKVCCAVTINL